MLKKSTLLFLFLFNFPLTSWGNQDCYKNASRILVDIKGIDQENLWTSPRILSKKIDGDEFKIVFLESGRSDDDVREDYKNFLIKNKKTASVRSYYPLSNDQSRDDLTISIALEFTHGPKVKMLQKIAGLLAKAEILVGAAAIFIIGGTEGMYLISGGVFGLYFLEVIVTKIGMKKGKVEMNNYLWKIIQKSFDRNPKIKTFVFYDLLLPLEDTFIPELQKNGWNLLTPLRESDI